MTKLVLLLAIELRGAVWPAPTPQHALPLSRPVETVSTPGATSVASLLYHDPLTMSTVARNGSNHATADSCFIEPCLSTRRLTGLTSSPQAF